MLSINSNIKLYVQVMVYVLGLLFGSNMPPLTPTVYAKADIEIEVLWETDLIIRSDDSKEIKLVGRIVEVGGESNVIEGMEVV